MRGLVDEIQPKGFDFVIKVEADSQTLKVERGNEKEESLSHGWITTWAYQAQMHVNSQGTKAY